MGRSLYSEKRDLVLKAREAMLSAVHIFNNPLITFKTESFIVLSVIARTYLLHAHYRSQRTEYRYFAKKGARKRFDRNSDGSYRYWELRRCIVSDKYPLDKDTKNNLEFLIGLRNQIEHKKASGLDSYLSARYQACALNFNQYLKKLHGERYGLDESLALSLQFAELDQSQAKLIKDKERPKIRACEEHLERILGEGGNGEAEALCNQGRSRGPSGRVPRVRDSSTHSLLEETRRKEPSQRVRHVSREDLVLVSALADLHHQRIRKRKACPKAGGAGPAGCSDLASRRCSGCRGSFDAAEVTTLLLSVLDALVGPPEDVDTPRGKLLVKAGEDIDLREDEHWFDNLLESIAENRGQKLPAIQAKAQSIIARAEAIHYIQLGNPELIIIDDGKTRERLAKDADPLAAH